MKLSKLLLVATLSVAAICSPVKKAEAGLLVMSPAAIIIGGAGLVAWTLPALDRDNQRGVYNRIFTPVFMTLGLVIVLDQDLDKVEGTLVKKFPTIPTYVISEASNLLIEKAKKTPFNESGKKIVSLTENEFSDLESAMNNDVSANDIASLKLLLTTTQTLN